MAKVLVTGIAVVDFVFQVETMPKRPEKHRAQAMEAVGGGIAANAAVAISRLGGQAQLLTRLGDDAVGDMIRGDLQRERVDLSASVCTAGARSPVSSVLIDAHGERLLVNFPGTGLAQTATPPTDFDAALVDTRWPEAALLTLQAAQATGKPGVLDGEAPVPAALVKAASHVVFSAQGLRSFTGMDDLEAALEALDTQAWIGVTDGARGIAVRGADPLWIPGFQIVQKDTLGAGDVWHGAFALALAEGVGESKAIRFAHGAAALKCMAFGGRKATPTRAELEAFLKERSS